jgi:hypothetical protein
MCFLKHVLKVWTWYDEPAYKNFKLELLFAKTHIS